MTTVKDLAVAVTALAVLLLVGTVVGSAGRDLVIRVCIYGLFALSLNLLIGYTGLISFGHALFFAGGAYVFVMLMQTGAVSVPLALLLTILANSLLALVVGAICVRTSEVYFAFLTLAFQMMFYSFLFAAKDITGGDEGLIGGIPRPPFWGISLRDPLHFYGFVCVVTVTATVLLRVVVTSPLGHVLPMIRDNPVRAAFVGVNVPGARLAAFVIAGAAASIAGVLLSLFVSGAYPNFAYWTQSGDAIFMVVLGSTVRFLGPYAGAFLLLVLNDTITAHTEHYGLVLGIVIIAVALGLRRGVLDLVSEQLARVRETGGKLKSRSRKNA